MKCKKVRSDYGFIGTKSVQDTILLRCIFKKKEVPESRGKLSRKNNGFPVNGEWI